MQRINTRKDLVSFIAKLEQLLADEMLPEGFEITIDVPADVALGLTKEVNRAFKGKAKFDLLTQLQLEKFNVNFRMRTND